MPVLIGTSGWLYRDWRGKLYPDRGVPQRRWLEYYAERFGTVELNNAFYRLPQQDTFARWRESTPPGFVMAVKASRYLSHIRRLRDPAEPVARLMARAAGLGDRLGPVLIQLPPSLSVSVDLLRATLRCFPPEVRVAVEPRHPSWWTGQVRDVLAEHDAALCWADRLEEPVTPLWRTASWGYLRFHEGAADPWPNYRQRSLDEWARRLADTWSESEDGYVYFNNDPGGAAVVNAVTFARSLAAAGRRTGRVPC